MKNNNNNNTLQHELKNSKIIRNLEVSGAFAGAILCGYDFAKVVTGRNLTETVVYSALGGYMVYFTAKHTLGFSESLTEIKKIKQKLK